jgi:hypothetical protein
MRSWGSEGLPGRHTIRRALPVAVAVLGSTLVLAGAGQGQSVARARPDAPRPTVSSKSGHRFAPALGDWEGTANGFPASFRLRFGGAPSGGRTYGLDELVALSPVGCPVSSSHYAEHVLSSRLVNPLGRSGSLGLSKFGFGGDLFGARSATLSRRYRTGSCSGTLTWHMRPAVRRPVQDGLWQMRDAAGHSSVFRVQAAGRLATRIEIPAAVTRCSGVSGRLDLFIGPGGLATISQRRMRMSIRFTRRDGTGQIDGRGCANGPLRFRVSRSK